MGTGRAAHMLDEAIALGLKVAPRTLAQIQKAADKNDYVRVRYMVTEDWRLEISPQSLACLTADTCESVRSACTPPYDS